MSKISAERIQWMLNNKPKTEKPQKASHKDLKRTRKQQPLKPYVSKFKPYDNKDLDFFIASKKTKPTVKKGERQTSLGERMIADWLVKNGIRFRREKQFIDLVNPATGKMLWLDFYLHSKKIVIEFDGKQHYKASKMFDRNGDSLEARIQRDAIKDLYCQSNGLNMVRIKYNQLNSIGQILSDVFKLK